MSDISDDMEAYAALIPDKDSDYEDFEIKRHAAIEYCYDHLDKMWAASIVGILLGCSFRDAKEYADEYLDNYE